MRWTNKARDTLFAMREAGETWTRIADTLGRSPANVLTFYRDEKRRQTGFQRIKKARRNAKPLGPPMPSPDWFYTRAVARLMDRVANDTGLNAAEVAARLIGAEPAPKPSGAERPYVSPQAFGIAA